MSGIVRSLLLRRTPASTRCYSSFFSSNSGRGGRYFNSAKHQKVVVTTNTPTKPEQASTEQPSTDGPQTQPPNSNPTRVSAASDQSTPQSSSSPSEISASEDKNAEPPKLSSTPSPGTSELFQRQQQQHPVVNRKDFRLHQFFSIHRPLLLLSNPTLIMDSAPPGVSFLPPETSSTPEDQNNDLSSQQSPFFLDQFTEASPDADAAAARQLTRALTINHAGATVAWEDTLRRLGIDVDTEREAERARLMHQHQEVTMDSVKRKRRKKMKKHKLKKRRRATRSQRMKIGR